LEQSLSRGLPLDRETPNYETERISMPHGLLLRFHFDGLGVLVRSAVFQIAFPLNELGVKNSCDREKWASE